MPDKTGADTPEPIKCDEDHTRPVTARIVCDKCGMPAAWGPFNQWIHADAADAVFCDILFRGGTCLEENTDA